jgi:segregation and condensation protein B
MAQDAPSVPTAELPAVPLLPTPEMLAPAIEAALLSLERPAGHERLAVALGLVTPDPDETDTPTPAPNPAPAPASSPLPAGVGPVEAVPGDPALESNEAPAEVAATRRRSRSGAAQKARREALATAIALIDQAVAQLNEAYAATGRSFRIEQVAGGFRVMTLPAHAGVVAALHGQRTSARLTKAAIETLAIIAYKQPITRAQLEAIRGVACGEVLRSLMDRRLITVKGRAEELGRPILYGTTRQFLDHFGLASITDLPTMTELKPV